MSKYVAFLRAVNVGGRNLVPMSELCDLFGSLGFTGVRSLLQSGNVIFDTDRRADPAIEGMLEAQTTKRFGVTVDYIVRSAQELEKAIASNPFPAEAKEDPAHLLVLFLKDVAEAKNVRTLEAAIQGSERIQLKSKQLYAVYPEGVGRSKLTNALIERKLGVRATGRNWNTVLKLAALCK
jgi:uncharacterized protein (DUF1697 family)